MIWLVLLESVAALCKLRRVTVLVFNVGFFIRCFFVLFETSCLIVGRDGTLGQRMPNKGDSVVWLRFKVEFPACIDGFRWFFITVEARAVSLVCGKVVGGPIVLGITIEASAGTTNSNRVVSCCCVVCRYVSACVLLCVVVCVLCMCFVVCVVCVCMSVRPVCLCFMCWCVLLCVLRAFVCMTLCWCVLLCVVVSFVGVCCRVWVCMYV
jgi:hypothetical protein